jgi:transposase
MMKRKNHSPDFKAKVALEAIREEMIMVELSKKYGVYPTQIGTWKRAAIKNMAVGFSKRGGDPAQVDDARLEIVWNQLRRHATEELKSTHVARYPVR